MDNGVGLPEGGGWVEAGKGGESGDSCNSINNKMHLKSKKINFAKKKRI